MEREAIRRTYDGADRGARRLGIDRRRFLRTVGGAALMLGAMAACESEAKRAGGKRSGGTFAVPDDPTDADAATEALTGDEFILDVQTHFLEYDLSTPGGLALASAFPQSACGADDPRSCFTIDEYLDELFLRSDTSKAVISALPIPGDANPSRSTTRRTPAGPSRRSAATTASWCTEACSRSWVRSRLRSTG